MEEKKSSPEVQKPGFWYALLKGFIFQGRSLGGTPRQRNIGTRAGRMTKIAAGSHGPRRQDARKRGGRMANMKEIARLAGVSLGTVSHVLNDTVKVREPLRKRVLDAVQRTGYQPSQLARGLRKDKTNILAMIIPDILNPFFPGVVRGAEDIAFANGYRLVLCNTDNDHAK
jgi:hypothetical protein